ncbi:MAG: YhcH/YjgK/YiaL family protein [Clostridiales bacterium]|jgi:YhcH/YjgK/YiaL family protein|nr:YhcH/YjgK/YiaL family protein [Clostridiales bacterium]
MIVDRIENIGRHENLLEKAAKISEFTADSFLASCELNECQIEGADCRFTPMAMDSKPSVEKQREAHCGHIDIHIAATGRECLEWIPLSMLSKPDKYHEEADVEFFSDSFEGSRLFVEAGHFAAFLPEDAHKPLIAPEGASAGGVKILIERRVLPI